MEVECGGTGLSLFLRVRSEAGGLGAEVGVQGFVAEERAVGRGCWSCQDSRIWGAGAQPTLTLQKKSREESSGEGSGVEILANRPYSDGPGGSGQYTHKIYHVGSHIPSWFRALLPKAALQVEEESWNAYPYTRTRWDPAGMWAGGCLLGTASSPCFL